MTRIAVTSRSFSRHPVLRQELLESYENVTFNDTGRSLIGAELLEFLQDHDKAIVALETLGDEAFAKLPQLNVISKYGVGFDSLEIDAMAKKNIKLGWTGGVNKRSVSELVIAFAVTFLRHIPKLNNDVRGGAWQQQSGLMLSERTIGIVGCGNVGKDLAKLLRAFGCKILAHDIADNTKFYKEHDIEAVDLETLLRDSDIVTLHLPRDSSTEKIINRERLGLLKSDAILINAARGGLVDETALKDVLQDHKIAGAAFDVFATEPPEDHDLLNLPNFIATPHIGGSTEEAILAMGRAAIAGLDSARVPDSNWPPRAL
jgi:phosphoglycerate dehydrogenase-like enzyme